jgi:hypothetical protein
VVREGIRVDRNARTKGDQEIVPIPVNPSTQTQACIISVMHICADMGG